MALPFFLQYKKTPKQAAPSVPSWAPAPEGDNVNLPQSQTPAQNLNVGPSIDLANAGTPGVAVKMPGPGAWDKAKPYAMDALKGLQSGGLGGAAGAVAAGALTRLIKGKGAKGFADGGDVTPYIGKRVRLGERGPELVVDSEGNVQPVGLHGEEEGVPTRPAVVIPHEALSDEGLALVQQGGATVGTTNAQAPAVRPRRAEQPTPDEARAVVQRRSMPDPNAPVEDTASPVMAAPPSPRPTLPPAAVEAPGLDTETTATRPRWTSELNREESHNAAAHDQAEHPQEARGWRRILIPMVRAAMAAMRSGDPLQAIGGAGAGALEGALDSRAANRIKYGREAAGSDARLSVLRSRRKDDLGAAQTAAQTTWLNERPGLEGRKIDASALKQSQAMLAREIGNRLKEPRPYDPSDAYDADLAARAQAVGVRFAPGAFGDFKNPATLEVLDPSDPTGTHKTRLIYDREGGGWRQLAADGRPVQTNYVQPVGSDGMTAGTRGSLALGGRRAAETERHDLVTESQGGQRIAQGAERIGIMRGHLSLAEAARSDRIDDRDRRDAGKADKLASQAERYAQAAESVNLHSKYIDPETGEEKTSSKRMIDSQKLAAQSQALRRELFASYGDLFDRGPDGRVRMTTAQYRSMFPSLGGNYVGDAQSMGVELTDADTTGQGTPVPSPMHRPAPRAHTPAAPHSQARPGEDPTVRAYADEHFHGNYTEALRKANADRAAKGLSPIQ